MAYDHTQYEVLLANDADLSATGIEGTWAPGLVPHIIRGVSITVTNAIGAAGAVTFEVVTAGGAVSSGTDIATVTIPNATAIGEVIYANTETSSWPNLKVSPGQEVICDVNDACAAGDTANLSILVEPQWEMPANNTVMTETT